MTGPIFTTLSTFGASLLFVGLCLANAVVAINHSPTYAALSPRQSSLGPIPPSCETMCAPFVSVIDNCLADHLIPGNSTCECSLVDEQSVGNCYECVFSAAVASIGTVDGVSASNMDQSAFNIYLSLCSSAGVTLPNITLSGTASVIVPGASSTVDSSQSTTSSSASSEFTSSQTVLGSSSGISPTSTSGNGALGMHKEMIVLISGYPLLLLLFGILQVTV